MILWANKWSCTVYIFLWMYSVHLKTDWWRFVVNCSFKPSHASHSQSAEKRDICNVFNVTTIAFPAFLCWILTENRQDLNFLRREQQREREREERRVWEYTFLYSSQGWLIVMKLNQDGRVVKVLDLRSNGRTSSWVWTPLLVEKWDLNCF